ncbi:MAG: Uma2 family endonuclease, partial [Acidobacteria bacterium]|nr:Uma2 family endonuclease [Acidobacteriota bacterium]
MLQRLPDDGRRRELLRGELISMSPVNPRHGRVVGRLSARVVDYAFDHDLGDVYVGDTGWRLERSPDTVLAPDIAFVRKDRLAEVDEVGFPETYPDLAIEVLSPSNTAAEMMLKLEIYSSCGVSAVWIVEPAREVAEIHRKGQ